MCSGLVGSTATKLQALLERLPPQQIISFERLRCPLFARACQWDLWGAAYQLKRGCSDNGFEHFLGWLLAQGQATFRRHLAIRTPVAYPH
jgi:Protein of unknown function (DUF4240)